MFLQLGDIDKMFKHIIMKPVFIITFIILLLNFIVTISKLFDFYGSNSITHFFIQESKYSYFYYYFLGYVSFIEIVFLVFVYKYQSVVLNNNDVRLFIYPLIIILSLSFSLGLITFVLIITVTFAVIYGYVSNEVFVTIVGTIYMFLLLIILIYQSIYLIIKVNKQINNMMLNNEKQVSKFFDIGLKSYGLFSATISMVKYIFNIMKDSFEESGKVPSFILSTISNLDTFETMAWGATITFLSIEIFIVNKVYFKKIFNYFKKHV